MHEICFFLYEIDTFLTSICQSRIHIREPDGEVVKAQNTKTPQTQGRGFEPRCHLCTHTSPTTPGSLPPYTSSHTHTNESMYISICPLLFYRFAMELNTSTYEYPDNVPQQQPVYDPWTSENDIDLGEYDYEDHIPEIDIPETPPRKENEHEDDDTKRVVVRVDDAITLVTQLRFPCNPGPLSDVPPSTCEVHSTVAATPDHQTDPGIWRIVSLNHSLVVPFQVMMTMRLTMTSKRWGSSCSRLLFSDDSGAWRRTIDNSSFGRRWTNASGSGIGRGTIGSLYSCRRDRTRESSTSVK